ncbi:DUF1284 domain-containing protein [Thermodesulfovibrio yellowstonii]|uniref:DUF1284 domain-containing protein n=1 Tax=Thermodesulfovibrio yellowstonii TaxID=28262 RepID=A0A9W6LLR4_9BACT|nr:DUF1284 domain-containing protein [Thermodesulfovibrio islandicus]GLI54110.1 hypothetical protein TISLANDTSLP1_18030 [Thermodesulfovibrio islandicus]
MIYLRGHHLICLHFFTGEGYNKEFVENLHAVIGRVENENVFVIEGADDICKKCPYLINNVCKDEKEIGEMDKTALDSLNLKTMDNISWDEIKEKLPEFFTHWYEYYCIPCTYLKICSKTSLFKSLRKFSS